MRKAPKILYVEFTRETIVGVRSHRPGEVVEVSPDTFKQLIRDDLAVPHVGRGRECMNAAFNQTSIQPFYDEETRP
jgi:hypothetical protein